MGQVAGARHMPEHPLITRYHQTRDGQAFKISDFLTRSQFHRLGLYHELYRRVQVEHQIAFVLPTPPPLIIGIALNRGRRDFSERERLLLNLLRPHLVQAYRNAEAVTQLHQELTAVRQALETLALGVIVLGRASRRSCAGGCGSRRACWPRRTTCHRPGSHWS